MIFFLSWIVLSVFVGVYARKIRRGEVSWFFLSLLLSPLITFVLLVAAGPPKKSVKKCPNCAEEIRAEAGVCRYCGFNFSPQPIIESLQDKPVKKYDPEIGSLASDYINKMTSKK